MATADNCILAFPNRIDECTLSGGSWSGTLPLTNLQNRIISKYARSADLALASTQFDMALPQTRGLRLFSLVNHNLTNNALYRLRGSSVSNFATSVYDSGWIEVWPVVYPWGTLEWEEDSWWTGKLSDDDLAGYRRLLIVILDESELARYWRLELDDIGNADGYVQAGRMFLAGQWQPAKNMSLGASVQFEDPSVVEEALGGAEYFDARTKYRVTRGVIEPLSTDDAFSRALEMQRRQGITEEVLFIYYPDDTVHRIRHSYLGRLRTLSPIEHPELDQHRLPVEIKEIVA